MNELYLKTALEEAKVLTKAYSTSFSTSLSLVDSSIRPAIYAVYGMVRVADEIVDNSWPGVDSRTQIDLFEKEVFEAIRSQFSPNLILHAFQWAVHTYGISHDHIRAFIESMRMDTAPQVYTEELYKKYIYGSAEVVGLMCLSVFCLGDKKLEKELEIGAKALGAAFQKINFLRDVQADVLSRKRIYFPGIITLPLTLQQKKEIEKDIDQDFVTAESYIKNVPSRARRGVRLAFLYYRALYRKIKAAAPEALKDRFSVSRTKKVYLLIKTRLS